MDKLTVGKLREIIGKLPDDMILKFGFTIDIYDDDDIRNGFWGTVRADENIEVVVDDDFSKCEIILWDETEYAES